MIKNLINKLNTNNEISQQEKAFETEENRQANMQAPVPPAPKPPAQANSSAGPAIHDNIQNQFAQSGFKSRQNTDAYNSQSSQSDEVWQRGGSGYLAGERSIFTGNNYRGGEKMAQNFEEGVILDLGEGISLNIPIQKRMSLGDFLRVAEKVKALEMLSEGNERNY